MLGSDIKTKKLTKMYYVYLMGRIVGRLSCMKVHVGW